ncbi:MAG: SIS domain-containing protein [Phycisphaeraceae bacterium]|jgi:arabinose-5-phosphate isomerase|nr:SIS domain-containing protein [Phycisphaeraceae bacterium]
MGKQAAKSLGRKKGAKAGAARSGGGGGGVLTLACAQLQAEARAVEALSAGLRRGSGAAFERAVRLLVGCAQERGTVLVTGLGKSGLVGAKIAATFASLGVPSHFIHPTEAAHGDLGNFRPADVCIAISYSGDTDEVVSLSAVLRQDGIDVIAICKGTGKGVGTLAGTSGLEKIASVVLAIGEAADEHLSPAPMASTTATVALGDALALCVSRELGVSEADFAKRHPGGSLGGLMKPVTEALRFRVGHNLHPAFDDLTVAEALAAADADGRRPGALLLVDRGTGKLTGIFTDGDLRRWVLKDPGFLNKRAKDVMTRNPSTLPDTARVRDAVRVIQQFRRDEIPVVDARGRPVGMLDVQDLITMRVVKE